MYVIAFEYGQLSGRGIKVGANNVDISAMMMLAGNQITMVKHKILVCLVFVTMGFTLVSCKTMDARLGEITSGFPAIDGKPTEQDFYQGVLDALRVGIQRAIEALGRNGGYYNDLQVKIPVSDQLQKVAATLRRLGQDQYVDQFIKTMNKAAEQAVPQATDIFMGAIRQMKIDDAKQIINGPDNAATEYFKSKTYAPLREAFLPVVKRATNQVNLTASYKSMTDKIGFLGQYLNEDTLDLDAYITRKALDGLFIKLAVEEKKIRHDPVARTTDILRKVFGQ